MTPKDGILHDYDLQANNEASSREQTCIVCEAAPMGFQWSDYSGQGMCTTCGTPYQLKWGSDEQVAEGEYPYLGLKPEWVPVVRRYFQETKKWTYLGMMMGGNPPGLADFFAWVEANNAAPAEPAPQPEAALNAAS